MKMPGAALILLVVSSTSLWASEPALRTLTAGGSAELRVVPNEAVVTLGVETFGTRLDEAKAGNDAGVSSVLASARGLGVPAEHLKTDFVSVNPEYRSGTGERVLLGYTVRRSIQVRLADIRKFDALLSGALKAGANYVHGVQFRTTELRAYRDRARKLALEAAREKAAAMAGALGQRIGKPITINEGYSNWWSTYGSWWGSNWSGQLSQNVTQIPQSGSGEDGPTSPGQISISAQVSVQFELVD